jgi:hypothetical protein
MAVSWNILEPWKPTLAERLDPSSLDLHNTRERRALMEWGRTYARSTTTPLTYAVTGSRTWWDWSVMWAVLSAIPPTATQRNGLAPGADALARSYWLTAGGTVDPYEANWKELGKRAGPIRNRRMINPTIDVVVGFLSHADESRGTRDAITHTHELGLPYFVFHQTGG